MKFPIMHTREPFIHLVIDSTLFNVEKTIVTGINLLVQKKYDDDNIIMTTLRTVIIPVNRN